MNKFLYSIKENRKKILLILLSILILLIFLWYQNNHIVTDVFVYKTDKLSVNADKFSIVQISDLHNAQFGKNNLNLLNEINNINPDIIAITGDIVDSNHTNINTAINFVRETAKKYPVYYVTGNHEYWLDDSQKGNLFDGIKDAGAVILNNEKTLINTNHDMISLIGLDDKNLNDTTLESIIEKCDKNNLIVVLAHEPQYIDNYCEAGADLVLTGHAHGGQIILPLLGALIAPEQGFFPKYTRGCFKKNNTTMYVSRGLGNSVIPVRLFNYPEIVCIELQG